MSDIDTGTLLACVAALRLREQQCAREGKSARIWSTAKRRVKTVIAQRAADDLQSETPAFLRRQAE